MANKSLSKLLNQLQNAAEENKEIEPLSDAESEELAGGSGVNVGCPENSGCNPGCTPANSGCPQAPAPS